MTKFLANLILSAAVGVTAAISFSPEVTGAVTGLAREISVTAQQAFQSAVDAAASTDVGLDVSVGASAQGSAALDTGLAVNANAGLTTESQTEADVETAEAGLSLTNWINSTLGIGIGLGK